MRQQHHQNNNQKSRGRGRGRKPQNTMSRNFESNGPDVKIRGNAAHIAEKYSTLARDCLSNGDRVIAENYLQHAEHYNRIVAAAQAQQVQQQNERQENEPSENETQAKVEGEQPQVEAASDNAEAVAKPNGRSNGRSNGPRSRRADNSDDAGKVEAQAPDAEAASAEVANDAVAEVAKDEGEKEKRKTTRARRPRKVAAAKVEKSDDADVSVEAISDDAAKLPDSITGGLLAEDG